MLRSGTIFIESPDMSVSTNLLPSITLAHPAKVVRRDEMPFGRVSRVVPNNIVLDGGLDGEIWESEPQSKFAFQIAAKPLQIV